MPRIDFVERERAIRRGVKCAGVGAIAGAILGGAMLGFPALIASTVVFGLAGGILGAFF